MPDDPRAVRFDVPAHAHPGMITGADDNPGIRTGRSAMEKLYAGYEKVNDLARTVSDRALLARGVQPFAENAIAQSGTDLGNMVKQRNHLAKDIEGVLTAQKNSPYAAEVRAHFKASAKPFMELSKMFREGDVTVISSVLSAPGFLSGIEPKDREVLRSQACLALCDKQSKDLADTDRAIEKVAAARAAFSETMAGHISLWQSRDEDVIREMLS